MTPEERQQVEELFDRLERLEQEPRDANAERLIARELQRAPNAVYALVQTVLIQDEALRDADARIRELESGAPSEQSFLDRMRRPIIGQPERRSSVPSVGGERSPVWNRGDTWPREDTRPQGGSFLGTAAATAAGVIGGALLLDSIRGMVGARHPQAQGFGDEAGGAGAGELARQAGVDDIGRGVFDPGEADQRIGLFESAEDDLGDDDFDGGDDSDFA
jgi:hypothetical protein